MNNNLTFYGGCIIFKRVKKDDASSVICPKTGVTVCYHTEAPHSCTNIKDDNE